MATSGSGVLEASNYDSLKPREQRSLKLERNGNTLNVKEKDKIRGLSLKPAGQINNFNLNKGTFRAFGFTGGAGSESLTVGKKAKAKGVIDLGADSAKDVVDLKKKSGFKGEIQNFEGTDELLAKGKTYTAADVKNGEIEGLGGIRFT